MDLQKQIQGEKIMALAENDYQGQLKEFKDKYGMKDFDLQEMAAVDKKFRYVNEFIMNSSVEGDANQFINWFSKTIKNYFEKHSQFSSDWKKNLSKFHTQEFLDDFEKVAKAAYLSELKEGQEPNRKPYAGAKKKSIALAITPYVQEINKPLPTVWMERMKKGTMDITELQQRCIDVTNVLKDNVDQKATMMEEFTRIVAAREAVRQLRESRPQGFLGAIWWLFNFRINARERDCLEALNTCVSTWEAQEFKTEKVLGELMGKTALGRPVNAVEKENQLNPKEVGQMQENPAVNEIKQEVAVPQMDPVAKQLDETLQKVNPSAMAQEFHEKLPANGQMDFMRTMSFQTLWKTASKNIGQINADFDSVIATGANPQTEMEIVVRKVFVDAFKAVKAWGDFVESENKIEATKIVAKTILERHTALALHPDKLGDAVNGYVEQYEETMKETFNQNKDFISEMENLEFNRVNTDNKERVFDDDNNPFKEDDSFEKSKPVDMNDSVLSEQRDLDI